MKGGIKNPDDTPFDDFWEFLKNKTQPGGSKIQESVVSSPVLHLNKTLEGVTEESTRIQMYPAVAVVINTFDKDGSLKSSATHFQPDFNSFRPETNKEEATRIFGGKSSNKNHNNPNDSQHTVSGYIKGSRNPFPGGLGHGEESRQGIPWPFANYFPIVINDPFMNVYNAFATGMYNAVSSMVEYGPEADICAKDKGRRVESENLKVKNRQHVMVPTGLDRYHESKEIADSTIFDEVTMRSDSFKRINRKPLKTEIEGSHIRRKRDTTSIYVQSRDGDTVDITLEEPAAPNANQRLSKGSDLILRKGGIAIAGPGGAATAYTGGTAIVGPYGTVYKSPEGTAILGPFSKVVDINDDTSFEEILRMHKEMQSQNQQPTEHTTPLQPGVEFKNFQNFFSYMTNLPIKFEVKPKGRSFIKTRPKIVRLKEEGIVSAIEEIKDAEFRKIIQDTPYEERTAKNNETTLIFRPKSKAEAGRNGVALSAPTSHAILYPGQKASIYFEPESVASAGPSGFAHAHSDLFVTYVADNTTVIPPEQRRRRSLKAIFLKNFNCIGCKQNSKN